MLEIHLDSRSREKRFFLGIMEKAIPPKGK
jgi:hypothetical protein